MSSYIVAGHVELLEDVTYCGAMATEQIAADAELDSRDAIRSVGIQQVKHCPRVAEYEVLYHAVLKQNNLP